MPIPTAIPTPTPFTLRKPLTPFLAGPRPDAPAPLPMAPSAHAGRPLREGPVQRPSTISSRPGPVALAGPTPR